MGIVIKLHSKIFFFVNSNFKSCWVSIDKQVASYPELNIKLIGMSRGDKYETASQTCTLQFAIVLDDAIHPIHLGISPSPLPSQIRGTQKYPPPPPDLIPHRCRLRPKETSECTAFEEMYRRVILLAAQSTS